MLLANSLSGHHMLRVTPGAQTGTPRHPHDGPNNTFIAIRTRNEEEDLLYSEFTDVTCASCWDFAPDKVNFHELYNMSADPFMKTNLYASAPAALKASLHDKLHTYFSCSGSGADTAACP